MVFSSAAFLFRLLVVTLAVYFAVPRKLKKTRNAVLLAASLLFYFLGERAGLLIMLASIAVNYGAALAVDRIPRERAAARRAVLICGIVFSVLLIGYYKYLGFILSQIKAAGGFSFTVPEIVMPIGISFFTFQGMSYLIDVYRGRCRASRNPLTVATYISLFPQLVAGPIVRYTDVEADLGSVRGSLEQTSHGARRFAFGLAKKMLIANPLGEAAKEIFAENGHGTPALAWLGAAAFTLQIYYDFSGYSDMAIGLGGIFGFRFPENFNYPYTARSVTDFWRRWHMTLSGWFRDYVYIPLGGNRKGAARQVFNIIVVWALTGIWHGASWNFAVWGLYFAALLLIEKFVLAKPLGKLPRPVGVVLTLILVVFGWVIFNSSDLPGAWSYIRAMFVPAGGPSGNGAVYYLLQYKYELILGVVFSMPVSKWAAKALSRRPALCDGLSYAAAACVFALSLMRVVGTSFNPFIYFRF